MNKTLILILTLLLILSGIVLAASTSASYKLATEAISVGTAAISSANYSIRSIARQRQLSIASSASFSVGEGFLRTAYYSKVIFAPIVVGITPGLGKNNTTVDITDLSGANFVDGCSVKLSKTGQPDIVATKVVVASTAKITCSFDLANAAAGLWDVTVTGSDGRSGTLPSAFTIGYPAPTISSVLPDKAANNEASAAITINGEYFRAGAAVSLTLAGQADITGQVAVESSTKIIFTANLVDKAVGVWDVVVKNDDNQSATLSQGFKVNAKALAIVGPIEISAGVSDLQNSTLKATAIKYNITDDSDVWINIYNMRGEKIWAYNALAGTEGGRVGINEIVWNGITAFKGVASDGVYFLHVTAKIDGKMTILQKTKFAIIKGM